MVLLAGVVIFVLIRRMMQRQAQKMHTRIQDEITPEAARAAALALNDDQHKAVYQAIAAEDAKRALAVFKQSTSASIQDSIVAIQALFRYPQPAPSEIRFEEGFNLNGGDDQVSDEYLEDAIDQVREDAEKDDAPEVAAPDSSESAQDPDLRGADASAASPDSSSEGPLAEADPNTGKILGENKDQVPDIPGGQQPADPAEADEEDLDAKARELLAAEGFNPDEELTIPEDWAAEDEQAGFHLEVQRGEEKITLSHEDLEPWVHDQMYALLRDDHVDQAAELLAANSPLTAAEAHRFLVVFKNQS